MNFSRALVAACVALMLSVSGGAAATVTETFDFTVGNRNGTTLDYLAGDVKLTLSGSNYDTPSGTPGEVLDENSPYKVSQYNGYGLGINYSGDNDHRIDGYYNEIVKFVFNMAVKIEKITFGSVLTGSQYDLYVGDNGVLKFVQSTAAATGNVVTATSKSFGIGASESYLERTCSGYTRQYDRKSRKYVNVCSCWNEEWVYSAFKIKGLIVKYEKEDENTAPVPLPAGGGLLLAGLVGLGLVKRRRAV